MPILHFSGKFQNQPPLYNNLPSNTEKYFQDFTTKTVKEKITEGVDPVEYFEFRFKDVYISRVTYDDGTSVNEKDKDAIIGKRLTLKALLVDTAPHLYRSRLFAGEIRIIDFMMGWLDEGSESDLFTTIRTEELPEEENEPAIRYSADFECAINDIQSLAGDFISAEKSRFFRECNLENTNYKIYFHLSKFYHSKLEGEVRGYIGLHIPELDDRRIRIHGRRLLVDPSITEELKDDFKLDPYKEEPEDVGRHDLEGTYEILIEKRLIVLRYLNFIPYMDLNNTTAPGYTFFVRLLNNGAEIDSELSEIKADRKSVSEAGGICILQLPDNIYDLRSLSMHVLARKDEGGTQSFMKEPEYDLLINDKQKYLILESAKKEEVKIQLYQRNSPSRNRNVRVVLQTPKNDNSPTVAWWTEKEARPDNDSVLICYVEARDLENAKEIEDVLIVGFNEGKKEVIKGRLSGELPWDRYYGNYVSIKIDNNSIITPDNNKELLIKYNIPVRVLHTVRLDDKLQNDILQLNKERIEEVMNKILSYYVRYYPWLHTKYVYAGPPPGKTKLVYQQFLKIREYLVYVDQDDLGNWELLQKCVNGINFFLDRLTREDNDWKKMPRSRDFPFNGVEFLKMYKASIIDNMINGINEERRRLVNMKSEGESDSEVEIDMDNWKEVQTLLSDLGDMANNRLSTDEDKKLIAICRTQIYDDLVQRLITAKTHTEHVHSH